MAIHSRILVGKVPCRGVPQATVSWGHKELKTTEHTHAQAITILPSHFCVGDAVSEKKNFTVVNIYVLK